MTDRTMPSRAGGQTAARVCGPTGCRGVSRACRDDVVPYDGNATITPTGFDVTIISAGFVTRQSARSIGLAETSAMSAKHQGAVT